MENCHAPQGIDVDVGGGSRETRVSNESSLFGRMPPHEIVENKLGSTITAQRGDIVNEISVVSKIK